jgi:signal transduction histidine kinase
MNKLIPQLIFIVLLALSNRHAYSQNIAVDSLKKIVQQQKEDTSKVNALNILAQTLVNQNDFSEGYEVASRALKLAEEIKYTIGKGKALQCMGSCLELQGKYVEARKLYANALQVFMEDGHKSEAADVYVSVASSYNGEQNSPAALENIYRSLKLYEEADNKEGIAGIYLMLGSKQISNNEYDVGISNLQLALKVFEKINDRTVIAVINSILADGYFKTGEFAQALECDSIALQIYDSVHSVFNKGGVFNNRASIYEAQGDKLNADGEKETGKRKYGDALQEYLSAIDVYKKTDSKQFEHLTNIAVGNLHIKLHNLGAAKLYLDKSAEYLFTLHPGVTQNFNSWFESLHLALSKFDSATGDKGKAYEHYKLYIAYRDSNATEEKAKKMQQLKLQYEFDKKESLGKTEQARKDAETTRSTNLQYSVIAIVLLAAIFFYWSSTQKQKAKLKIEQAYIDLKSTQAQLVQSEKMASLGELTAGIAHEIQNPLNFVNNFSEVNKELLAEMNEEMEKGNYDEVKTIAKDVTENGEKINHHGKRADAIVKGMLQHSRSSSGQKELTDINALADEYLRLAYHGLRAKDKMFNAAMKTDYDETLGLIKVIPQDIGRVVLNLITNAFYAVSERKKQQPELYEPVVSVGTKNLGDRIEIHVKDNGNGIPQKVLDKIFQPFFTTKPTGQGTGLGLSLSYDIVKAHGGELNVETKEGEGSVFTLQIPIN